MVYLVTMRFDGKNSIFRNETFLLIFKHCALCSFFLAVFSPSKDKQKDLGQVNDRIFISKTPKKQVRETSKKSQKGNLSSY